MNFEFRLDDAQPNDASHGVLDALADVLIDRHDRRPRLTWMADVLWWLTIMKTKKPGRV